MDSSVLPEDKIWFLHVCHHISNAVYHQPKKYFLNVCLLSFVWQSDLCSLWSQIECYTLSGNNCVQLTLWVKHYCLYIWCPEGKSCCLWCDTVSLCKQLLMLQKYVVASTARVEKSKRNAPHWELLTQWCSDISQMNGNIAVAALRTSTLQNAVLCLGSVKWALNTVDNNLNRFWGSSLTFSDCGWL